MYNWTVFFIAMFAISLVGCTAIPPLDNPDVSFGRKCQDDGSWSFVWIHDHDAGLTASKEKCND
tara:strand:+ start:141 stop:332 length:192 start_codon:yes stop_codon:yes gene_type:complete